MEGILIELPKRAGLRPNRLAFRNHLEFQKWAKAHPEAPCRIVGSVTVM